MMRLCPPQKFRERRFPAQRVEPWIAGHRRKTENPSGHDTIEEIERRTNLVQMGQVPRQVEEPLGIPKVRCRESRDSRGAFGGFALDQRSGRDDEIPQTGWNPVFELTQRDHYLSSPPQLRLRDRDDIGERL